jgi:hypothetical protein
MVRSTFLRRIKVEDIQKPACYCYPANVMLSDRNTKINLQRTMVTGQSVIPSKRDFSEGGVGITLAN